jgi:hypothetical protein
MACPMRCTRSPWTAVWTRPVRADAGSPVRQCRSKLVDQYAARAVWALPVTGSRGFRWRVPDVLVLAHTLLLAGAGPMLTGPAGTAGARVIGILTAVGEGIEAPQEGAGERPGLRWACSALDGPSCCYSPSVTWSPTFSAPRRGCAALVRAQARTVTLERDEVYLAGNGFRALRDTSVCTAAISQARTQVDQLRPDDDPSWLYWLDPAAITISAGNCFLQLGKADQAAVLLNEGIAGFSESFVRDRQIHLTQLADALARPGKQRDLDAAAGLGMQSIDLAKGLDSTRGTGLLRDLYFRMKPHSEVPAVRDFVERARGLVA